MRERLQAGKGFLEQGVAEAPISGFLGQIGQPIAKWLWWLGCLFLRT